MFVTNYFELDQETVDLIHKTPVVWGWGDFSEFIYYNNYSRTKPDGSQETWHDTVIRIINGVFSIRKDWYLKNHIHWIESRWQDYARRMAVSLVRMEWTPPGRGVWAMGTPLVYERGSMALYNCAYTDIRGADDWIEDVCWIMDVLMYGVGVGFGPVPSGLELEHPTSTYTYVIPDTREGWVESVRLLLRAFGSGVGLPKFDYSLIRSEGELIKTFGGLASGPAPLQRLHETIVELSYRYIDDPTYHEVAYKTDIANLIGVCVVTGNVRRSAEIAIGEAGDDLFMNLKDYTVNEYRKPWGWMSNNTVRLRESEDFEDLDYIVHKNTQGHDMGLINMRNLPHGRIGKHHDAVKADAAVGFNPCGEIPLEHREVCNLAETIPTRCVDNSAWLLACEFATFYTSTVALLPTHQHTTNAVVSRNRRIGVSIIDFVGWKKINGTAATIRSLRDGYAKVTSTNKALADEAGVPESIRKTTVKPGGTIPKLAGRVAGASYPTFTETLRRVNVRKGSPVDKVLQAAGVPFEVSVYTPESSNIYEFPIVQGPAPPATEVSVWEQAMNIVLLQREWADNAVSNTLYFRPRWFTVKICSSEEEACQVLRVRAQAIPVPHSATFSENLGSWVVQQFDSNHEEDQLEAVIASVLPYVKSLSFLPHSPIGIFKQMPEEGLTQEAYYERLSRMPKVDWSLLAGHDGTDEKYCEGDHCAVTPSKVCETTVDADSRRR